MNSGFVNRVVKAIAGVVGGPCALHEPVFAGNEQKYVAECIKSGWVSSVGSFVDRFELDLARYTGARFAIATVNGTSALHTALVLAGVEDGDEVIVPALSFVATANAVSYCGAVPHFVDVCSRTLGMDASKLREHLAEIGNCVDGVLRNRVTGSRIAAMVPMHTFGHPCEMDAICDLAAEYHLPVVEDAAESLGSFYHEKHTGTFGQMGVLSFNGNKIVTAGGGGAIITDDEQLAKRAKHLTTTAKVPHKWAYEHDAVGFNYRMPNLNAALACAQLEQLEGFLRIKRATAQRYQEAFASIDGVSFVTEPERCESNYWLNAIRLNMEMQGFRDDILEATNTAGLMTRPCWTPLNRLKMYQQCSTACLDASNALFARLINVPSGAGLTGAEH